MENENKNIENKNETTPNIEKSKIETIKDLEKQASEIQAKLEKLKNESKEYENKNISKIDNNISELGLTENEETISVKKEIGGIEQNKQNTIDSGINEIKKITYETSTPEKINEENTADFITEFNRMKREADTEKMMKEIEEEDLENELQKKKEEEFFEKFKNGENLEENNKLKEYTEGNIIITPYEGVLYKEKVIKTAEDKGSYYLTELEPIYEEGGNSKRYPKEIVELEKNQDGSIGKIIYRRPHYSYEPRESRTTERLQENNPEKKETEILSLEEEYKKAQEEEDLILEELGKLKGGEKPSRELEERNLKNENKLRELENKLENKTDREPASLDEVFSNDSDRVAELRAVERRTPEEETELLTDRIDKLIKLHKHMIENRQNFSSKEINEVENTLEDYQSQRKEILGEIAIKPKQEKLNVLQKELANYNKLNKEASENPDKYAFINTYHLEQEIAELVAEISEIKNKTEYKYTREEPKTENNIEIKIPTPEEVKTETMNENDSEKVENFSPGDTIEFDGDKIIKVEKSKGEATIQTPEEAKTETMNENDSEKVENFSPGDTIEFDGDKIIKVEKSKGEATIQTPEEAKTEESKETGTEDSKETTNENKEATTSAELNEEEMDSVINPKNKEGFKNLSKQSQSFMSKVYSGLIKIPVDNRFIGKIKIAYNQFLFDKKEKQRLDLKSKLYGLETRSETLNEVKKLNQETAEFLEGIDPNAKNRAEKEGIKIDKQRDKIETKIDKVNSKISQKEISLEIFKNRRDAVIDRFVTNYEIKASPLEGKLNLLSEKRKAVEEISIKAESEISKAENRINILKISRDSIMENLSLYLSEKDIDKNEAIKSLNENIDLLYLSIQAKRNEIAREKDKIDIQINKKLKKISPYLIKKNELLRIKSKEINDIDFNEIKTEYRESENNSPKENIDDNKKEELKFEKSDTIENTIKKYLKFLEENNGSELLKIDEKEFVERTELPSKNILKINNFKKILEIMYEEKGIKKEDYINLIDKII